MSHRNIFIGEFERQAYQPGRHRVAIKDNIDLQGRRTTAGSRSRDAVPVAAESAAIVTALENAPDVDLIGKTNLDEFANGATGENPWFGDVSNPFNPDRVIGGSSSGSAGAVAHGFADFAIGTDTGGSVRIPAALCGLIGLKTTRGLVSTRGVYPLSQFLDTVGPIAKTTKSLRRAMELIAPGEAPSATPASAGQNPKTLKVARLRFTEPETAVDLAVDAALAAAGVEIENLQLSEWENAHHHAYRIIATQCWSNSSHHLQTTPELVGATAAAVMRDGESTSIGQYRDALKFAATWAERIEGLFDTYDYLVAPTVSEIAPLRTETAAIDWLSFSRTMQFNLSGHPAISLPVGEAEGESGIGLQVIGRYGADLALLDVADLVLNAIGRGERD